MPMRPQPSEYNPFYETYVSKVVGDDPISAMEAAEQEVQQLLGDLTEEQWNYRYEPGKWSVKELLGHMMDSERVFAFRALSFARGETAEFPGFEQNGYVLHSKHQERTGASLLAERKVIRESTLHLLRNLGPTEMTRSGKASGSPVSVRALAYILGGHDLHHLSVLKDRYLK